MTHVGHVLRWDARRLRWILALWTLVVAAYTVLVGVRPFASVDPSARESFAVADSLLWLTMMLISFGLVSFVIHGHPTVGTEAFWMTRAIPPRALLASKLALISLSLLAVPTVADAVLVAWLWPFPFLRHRFVVPDWIDRIVVRVDPATISTNTPNYDFFASRRHPWNTVNGLLQVDEVGIGWSAGIALREASLQLPNGVTLRSPSSWSTYVLVGDVYSSPREYRSMRDLLGVEVIALQQPPRTGTPPRQSHPVLFVFRRDDVAPLLPARGHYRARMDVNLTQFAIEGAIPLRPGASQRNGGYHLVIDRTTTFDNEFAIVAREARATSMWERRPWAGYAFYLRNRERGQAVAVNDYTLRGGFTLLRFLPIGDFSIGSAESSGFSSRGMVLRFPPRYTPTAETLDVDAAWLAGAELVIVRRTEEGWVERTIEIPDFPIGQ